MSYTKEQARHLYNMAFAYELCGYELLKDADAVVRECNGVGASWMPEVMRDLCTMLNSVMELPAAIHDMRYARGTTRQDKKDADNEFLTNCFKVIREVFAWWNPWRYIMMRRAVRFTTYLELFGDAAFKEAKKK